jgi:hypothetical protein
MYCDTCKVWIPHRHINSKGHRVDDILIQILYVMRINVEFEE